MSYTIFVRALCPIFAQWYIVSRAHPWNNAGHFKYRRNRNRHGKDGFLEGLPRILCPSQAKGTVTCMLRLAGTIGGTAVSPRAWRCLRNMNHGLLLCSVIFHSGQPVHGINPHSHQMGIYVCLWYLQDGAPRHQVSLFSAFQTYSTGTLLCIWQAFTFWMTVLYSIMVAPVYCGKWWAQI